MPLFVTRIPINNVDTDVEVEFNYIPATRGHRDKYGAPEEPDDPAECEIESVVDFNGNERVMELSVTEFENVYAQCWKHLVTLAQDAPEPPEPPAEYDGP